MTTSDDNGAANETLHAIRDNLSAESYASFACDWANSGATMISQGQEPAISEPACRWKQESA